MVGPLVIYVMKKTMILGLMLLVFVATGCAQMPVLCGWLTAGTPVDTVLSRWGEPTLKDETGYTESTGSHFEEWTYDNGVTMLIELDTLGVAKNVRIVTADSPCQCPILDGFTIGSQLPEVFLDKILPPERDMPVSGLIASHNADYSAQSYVDSGMLYIIIAPIPMDGGYISLKCLDSTKVLLGFSFGWLPDGIHDTSKTPVGSR